MTEFNNLQQLLNDFAPKAREHEGDFKAFIGEYLLNHRLNLKRPRINGRYNPN